MLSRTNCMKSLSAIGLSSCNATQNNNWTLEIVKVYRLGDLLGSQPLGHGNYLKGCTPPKIEGLDDVSNTFATGRARRPIFAQRSLHYTL